MQFSRVKIITTVPPADADALREVLGKAGAGNIGEYSFCSFSCQGQGRFIPSENANPHIGKANKLEIVEEERIEVICDGANARQVIAALRQAHPYEEPAIDIVPLLSEEDLEKRPS